jgi:glycosyltransferase involved in cell wall biosynthesis
MHNPQISVIMSTYNNEESLEKSIKSILNQSFKNFEFIIINDGSTDSSNNIIEHYANLDSRIINISQINKGLTKSLNIAINIAKGKYIARQDADDESLPDRFSVQLDWLEKYDYDFCSSRAILNNSGRIIPALTYFLPYKLITLFKNPFIHGSFLIKRKILEEINGYDESFIYAQDYKLIIDLINVSAKIKFLKSPLYILGESKDRISIAHLNEQFESSKKIQKLYFKNILNSVRKNH